MAVGSCPFPYCLPFLFFISPLLKSNLSINNDVAVLNCTYGISE